MDWDGNQEQIRQLTGRIDRLVSDMSHEEDYEARMDLVVHISRDLHDVLTKCENMTRWLKRYENANANEEG